MKCPLPFALLLAALCAACDLQPKIAAIPESVGIGEFISTRYPAMLADPETQPEIYNSAASDYGVYASPDMYGSPGVDDYIQYASIDDYVLAQPAQSVNKIETPKLEKDVLKVPEYIQPARTQTPAETDLITITAGDTLYSLSRKYEIPVNDLAVMNNLSAPFSLSVGQKLKVPKSGQKAEVKGQVPPAPALAPVVQPAQKPDKPAPAPVSAPAPKPAAAAKPIETKEKVSSSATVPLPKIAARASALFSWPVRGKILSDYGAKSNGLFNDGINISAKQGTTVSAAENGVVAYAGNELKGMGNLIIVQHAGGWMTVYAHLDSMTVKRGTKVSIGGKLGTVGQTGKVSEPQLHFEIRKGTKAYNPTSQLKK
ncbi:MAG: M23 family metallopeptidase [Rickettsiales bacterium]|jgi:murein DD-endopeptidase MepM/ murein hydrolase activator NlpD|nr:M23 family metallopeptidase [Rickettsiales bacterium]